MKARRLRTIGSLVAATLLVIGLSVAGASVSGAAGLSSGPNAVTLNDPPMPTPTDSPTSSPSPSPTCGPDEECAFARDQIDMFDDVSPMPSPTGAPTATSAGAGAPRRMAAAAGVPCGTAFLEASLRGPRGGAGAVLNGDFGVVSFVGSPIVVTARRQTVINGIVQPLDNDGGPSAVAIYNVAFGPRILARPVTVGITETGGAIAAVFFTYGAGRTCRGSKALNVNVAL